MFRWRQGFVAASILVAPVLGRAEALPSHLRVRLLTNQTKIDIRGPDLQIENQNEVDAQTVAVAQNSRRLLIWKDKKRGHSLWHWQEQEARSGAWVTLREQISGENLLHVHGHHVTLNDHPAPDDLLIFEHRQIEVAGIVPIDQYVLGVVAKEMPLQWPLEALKAQAVAVRSYSLVVAQEREHELVQLESNVQDQVFSHLSDSEQGQQAMANVKNAVDATRGEILQTKSGRTLKAFYHSDCGGRTSSSKAVFGVNGVQGGVVDDSCPLRPQSQWRFQISRSDFQAQLQEHLERPLAAITKVELVRPAKGDRVHYVRFLLADGQSEQLRAENLRDWFGYDKIRSTLFEWQMQEDKITISGRGYGHGVGLCQWGTRGLAQQGWTHTQILRHYYPESQIGNRLETREDFHSKKADSRQDHQVRETQTL